MALRVSQRLKDDQVPRLHLLLSVQDVEDLRLQSHCPRYISFSNCCNAMVPFYQLNKN